MQLVVPCWEPFTMWRTGECPRVYSRKIPCRPQRCTPWPTITIRLSMTFWGLLVCLEITFTKNLASKLCSRRLSGLCTYFANWNLGVSSLIILAFALRLDFTLILFCCLAGVFLLRGRRLFGLCYSVLFSFSPYDEFVLETNISQFCRHLLDDGSIYGTSCLWTVYTAGSQLWNLRATWGRVSFYFGEYHHVHIVCW